MYIYKFIPYRILLGFFIYCSKAAAKLRNKNEVFLRSSNFFHFYMHFFFLYASFCNLYSNKVQSLAESAAPLALLLIQHFPRIEVGLPCGFCISTNLCGNKIAEEPGSSFVAMDTDLTDILCSCGGALKSYEAQGLSSHWRLNCCLPDSLVSEQGYALEVPQRG